MVSTMTIIKGSSVFEATIECTPAANAMRLEEVTLHGYLDFSLWHAAVSTSVIWSLVGDSEIRLHYTACHGNRYYLSIKSHPLCLPVTPALSTAPLELSHLTQVELLLPAIPDDMTDWDTRCSYCYVPASRPAQATMMKTTWKTEEQRQPRKVLHMP